MLLDEIGVLFNQGSIREISRRTGLSRGKVESLRNSCSFVLDGDFIAALNQLAYTLLLVHGQDSQQGGENQ